MGKNLEKIELIRNQERELVFDDFNSGDAFNIGKRLIDKAIETGVAYAINITLNRRQLFHFSMDGVTPDNDRWIARKENIVYNFFASSYRITLEFEDDGNSLNPRFGISDESSVLAGGSFPLTIRGVGVVGTITVSGLPQEDDHDYVVSVITEYLKTKKQ